LTEQLLLDWLDKAALICHESVMKKATISHLLGKKVAARTGVEPS